MKKFCTLLVTGLLLSAATVATAQDRLLIGNSRHGGVVFQTLRHRGQSNIRSEMSAEGVGSRTESHADFDDYAPVLVGPASTPAQRERAAEPSVEQKPAPVPEAVAQTAAVNDAPQNKADGGHLICISQADGSWRACGLTSDLGKAQHAVHVLRQQEIQARVFQFLPLPAEVQKLPLLPNENAIGIAVKLSGEVYGVTKDGRLIEILMPTAADSE
jgi:hypothetical protein